MSLPPSSTAGRNARGNAQFSRGRARQARNPQLEQARHLPNAEVVHNPNVDQPPIVNDPLPIEAVPVVQAPAPVIERQIPTTTVLHSSHRYSSLATEYFKLTYNVQFVTPPDAHLATHPVLHGERLIASNFCIAYLASSPKVSKNGRVVEIGANPVATRSIQRHQETNIAFHNVMPLLQPGDTNRAMAAAAEHLRYCTHTLQECTCIVPSTPENRRRPIQAMYACHSIYYFTPQELADIFDRTLIPFIISVEHEFDEIAGTLANGELRYYMDKSGNMICNARGNSHHYSHNPRFWTSSGGAAIGYDDDVNPRFIQRAVVKKFRSCVVCIYTIEEGRPPSYNPSVDPFLTAVGVADNSIGQSAALVTVLNKEALNPSYDVARVPFRTAYYFGGLYVLTRTDKTVVPMPRGLIGALTVLAIGKPRDPTTYNLLLSRAKRTCASIQVPDELASEIVVLAAVAAMARSSFETDVLGLTHESYKTAWKTHARVLSFEPLRSFQPSKATALYAASCAPSIYFSGALGYLGTGLGAVGSLALAHPLIAVPVLAAVAVKAYSHHSSNNPNLTPAIQWALNREEGLVCKTGYGVAHHPGTAIFSGFIKPKPFTPNPNSLVKFVVRHWPDKERTPPPGLRWQGIAFSEITPSFIPSSMEAALFAIQTRLQLPIIEPEESAWAKLDAKFDDPLSVLYTRVTRDYVVPDDIDALSAAYFLRFPPADAARLEAAYEDLKINPWDAHLDTRLELMIKREKTGTVDIEGPSCNNPRCVLDPSPRFNAYSAPIGFDWTIAVRQQRTIEQSPYCCWAISSSGEEMGAWHDQMVEHYSKLGEVWFWDSDQSAMDMRQGKRSMAHETLHMKKSNLPSNIIDSVRSIEHIRGVVKQHQYIRVKSTGPKRISGYWQTTGGNCGINESTTVHIHGEPGPETYAVMICGDDNHCIGLRKYLDKSEDESNKLAAQLGFKLTVINTNDVSKVEFCSLLPYPTKDGTVFGPKIGRQLHRAGWTTSSEKADIYGAAVSMENSVSFIPFLREYFAVHRQLSTQTEKFRPYDRLATNKHETTPATWEFLEARYGLTPKHLEHFQSLLDQVQSLPVVIDWDPIVDLVRIDA